MPTVGGQTQGLKKSDIAKLDKLYRRTLGRDQLFNYDLADEICELALALKRPVGVILDPKGHVHWVYVGTLADIAEVPQGQALLPDELGPCQLNSYYGFHAILGTQSLSNGEPRLDAQVTALQYRFPVLGLMIAGTDEGFSQQFGEHPKACDGVILLSPTWSYEEQQLVCQARPRQVARILDEESLAQWVEWGQATYEELAHRRRQSRGERAILIGIDPPGTRDMEKSQRTMDELYELAKTAGATIVGEARQKRAHPDPGTFLGQGKAEEVALLIQQQQANIIIADDTLSPVQQRNLEKALRVKVIDRTEVILDIFAQRARSREGQIQVELAQLKYLLPRLMGRGRMFSQQTSVGAKGGIATRGPGETKLETDRRVIHQRVDRLEKEAESVVAHRKLQRNQRLSLGKFTAALIGYTNAGKSTLLKRLTGADVLVEDKLFATLDPTTRRLFLPSGTEILMSDTVGFIQKLPTFLVKAFRATLEEVQDAQLVLHVWDISHPDRDNQMATVLETLESLDALELPRLTLCNKIDALPTWQDEWEDLTRGVTHPYPVSATTGEGLDAVLTALSESANTAEALNEPTLS